MKKGRCIIFVWGIVCIIFCLSFSFTNDRTSYTRVMTQELKNEREIEYLFLGASRAYRGIDPQYIDVELYTNSFNVGTSSQRPEDSYYFLKSILKKHKVSYVVYDINYSSFQNYQGDSTIRTHIILDYLPFSMEKIQYAKSVLGSSLWSITPLSNIIRYKAQWKNGKQSIENLYMHLLDKDYLNYNYENVTFEHEYYSGKGFVFSKELPEDKPYTQVPWDFDNLYPKQIEYLEKIIQLCDEYDCELIFISIPVQKSYIEREANYTKISQFFYEISSRYNVDYYDFNCISLDEMSLTKRDFKDEVHMNGYGAEKFSRYLANLLLDRRITE